MTWIQALVLGALQGVTEFLPISSSGHLVLFPWLLNWEVEPELLFPFTVVIHWGTLLAVVAAFWKDLRRLASAAIRDLAAREPFRSTDAKLAWLLLLATIPAALAGILIGDAIKAAFARPELVAFLLLINAGLLMTGEGFRRREVAAMSLSDLGAADAITIGVFQILALFPGISRSGSTIVGGLVRGFERLDAARFALLLAAPIMLGAGIVALGDSGSISSDAAVQLIVGFASAALVGFAAIRWLLRYLQQGSLMGFAIYCAIFGLTCLAVALYRG